MDKKWKVPKLRFPGFTEEWAEKKLGEITKRITRKNTNLQSTLALTISAQDGLIDQNAYFNKRVASRDISNYYLIKKGEFAYNKSYSDGFPFGAIKRLERYEMGVLSTLYIVFALNSALINSDYLVSYFDTDKWHQQIAKRASEGARNHGLLNISANDYFDIKVILPKDLKEQNQIGDFVKKLDNLIILHREKLEHWKEIKKGLLQKMFPNKEKQFPEIRFTGFTDAWEQRKLGDVAENTYGGGTPKTSVENFWNGDIPWIQSQDIMENQVFDVKPRKYISEEAILKSATKMVPKNSIAIVIRVGVGKVAFMPFSYCTSQDFISLSKIGIDDKFATYAIYKMLQKEKQSVQGTSIKGITFEEILSKKIDIPVDGAEQKKIGDYFQQLDDLITLHQRKLDHLKELKKGLLQQMFV